ncbi:alanine--tRNA ligase [Candidatus Peribacteria bacterium RIFCSPHIGHO2_02_FULL_52_16]|nr:MAG: alanine--tRNA ligase [Candidatus Peribacteria bacterium RIFCSPHIGHO2_01_FULL_51_35]OGJ60902.1 MAG: alanine--tRNA ligase [Candidatus Peribacteria bacterium RIFCSPHIGHO2_02_FULL_52_16]
MSTDQVRKAYLDFFQSKGHAVIPGAPLIPENDPTVLFTTAGMHPLVPYLMGEKHPAGKLLADVQRCIRTQDIDEVGDASHLTMFEMLGNWSLGDYFKQGAIEMSFEFITKVLGIPLEKFGVTCFAGDKDAPKDMESAKIWMSLDVPEERIGFLPKAKNWWGPAGKTGPCGPDTEMFYWIGDSKLPPKGSNPANDEANWLEIWNDVFMQYNKKDDGTFEPLKQQNVDTGMGLERVVAVLQGVKSVYDTDRMKPIVDKVRLSSSLKQTEEKHVRIVSDHLKAATFIIADGVKPSNVDQGYVLRKLIRRAVRSMRMLGNEEGLFTASIARAVIEQYEHAYPSIKAKENDICDALQAEEQQFGKTLQEGLKRFQKTVDSLSGKVIDGLTAFHLYDTYGFPLELTKEMATELGLTIDEKGFENAFAGHQELSRAGAEKKFAGGLADHSAETTKLHTATHLLNAALRKVLGDHVQQKGSNITAERLRFDFNHADKMTPEQIAEVERLVNEVIKQDLPIAYHLTTVDGAKAEGAIGVFDDRYGQEVKVYQVGDSSTGSGQVAFSKEICGGPHVARTGMLGSFKIQKEESSSAGVRRIKAVVSGGSAEIDVAKEAS